MGAFIILFIGLAYSKAPFKRAFIITLGIELLYTIISGVIWFFITAVDGFGQVFGLFYMAGEAVVTLLIMSIIYFIKKKKASKQ